MKKLPLLFILAFLFINAKAQPYLNQPVLHDRPASKKATFFDIQKSFEEYWKDKPHSDSEESENREGGGYQQFKRWEWFAKQRTFPKGEFPDPEILFNEYQLYKNNSAQRNSVHTASANWSLIGPNVVAANGGGSGRINCITFDPVNPLIIWIGTACGGLWRSTDGGQTWSSNTDLLPSLSISEIVIDASNPQNMYLATGDKYGIYYGYQTWGQYSAGILKSTDGGVTWNATGMNYVQSNVTLIERLIQDPNLPNTLFAATNIGIFETTNGGTTWNNIKPGRFYDLEMNPANHNIIYTGDSTGFLRSTDAGVTWNYINGVGSTGRTSIAVSASNANTVYVWSEGGAFYYSNNSGASFITRTDPTSVATPYGYYDMVLEVSPVNDNVLFTGGLNIAKSTDGGVTWNSTSTTSWPAPNYVHADNHALKFANGNNNNIFSCNDGGIFSSTDQGNTWGNLSNGLAIKQYYRMSSSALTTNLMYAGAQDNGTDKVTGLNAATQVFGADGEGCLTDYTTDNVVFVSYQGGNFYKSTDGGATFNTVSATGCDWTSPIVMDPTNNNILYMGSDAVQKSLDNGNTWTNMSGTLDGTCVYSLEICNQFPNYVYAATFGHIYRSTNGGTTWTNITATLPVNSAAISGVAVSGSNHDAVWVTFSGYAGGNKVYYSSDGGVSWTNVSGTLPNIPANCIEYQNGSNDIVYLGTDLGVFYKDATMNDWVSYNTGLPNVIIDELEVYYPTSKLRAATYGRSIWESDLQISTLSTLDASTVSMLYPPTSTCDSVIAPIVRIRNAGIDTIFTAQLHYRMDAQAWQVYSWSGTLPSQATYDITLPTYTLSSGVHTLKAYTAFPNSSTDQNPLNDTIVRTFTTLPWHPAGNNPPLVEGFVPNIFPPAQWSLANTIWSRSTACGGYGTSSESALADFYNIPSGTGMLISPYIDFTNALPPIRLHFDLAYAPYSTTYVDSLVIDLYDDCPGAAERIYANASSGLATAPTTTTIFTPTSNQWRTDTLNLDSLAGHLPMRIRFRGISGYGNELYIDNINLSSSASGVNEISNTDVVKLFPNPANNMLNVEITTTENERVSIQFFDMLGKVVKNTDEKMMIGKSNMTVDISDLRAGMYLVKVTGNNSVMKTERVAVIK